MVKKWVAELGEQRPTDGTARKRVANDELGNDAVVVVSRW